MEYKRPTKVIELPSGKKVEIVTYFSKSETEEIQSTLLKGKKITLNQIKKIEESGGGNIFNDIEFDLSELKSADKRATELAIKNLIDADGKKYEATIEGINDFLNEDDGAKVVEEINKISKKKPIEGK